MIKVVSFNSEEVNKVLNLKEEVISLKNTSILTSISNEDSVGEIIGDKESVTLLKDIKIENNIFIFDFLQELKKFVRVKEAYLMEAIFLNIASTNSIKIKKQVIEGLTLEKDFYKEVLKIFFNRIVRETHSNKIILLKLWIDENHKMQGGNKVDLTNEEKNITNNINRYLKKLYELYEDIVPNGIFVECIEKIYMEDFKAIKFHINTLLIEEISKKIDKNIKEINIFKGEKIYPSYNNVKYYFEKAKLFNKDKLVVIFSAFSNDKPKYNYINSLKFIDCNKLFILDEYGSKGTYYLGENGDFNIETSVMSLISNVMANYNINFKNVICAGSSKGGTAALYYGLKYSFGNIIAGAPQYKIGTYLIDLTVKEHAKEIFGDLNEKNRIKYNNLIRVSVNNKGSNIFLLTGDGDPQYKRVLKDFENISREYKLNLDLEKCDIDNHADIAQRFPEYLCTKLEFILEKGCINIIKVNKVTVKLKDIKKKIFKK